MRKPFDLTVGLIVATETAATLAADFDRTFFDDLRNTLGREPTKYEHIEAFRLTVQGTIDFVMREALKLGATDDEARRLGEVIRSTVLSDLGRTVH